ncbi:MAG: rhomboid family intramembrane serine protease [Oculatellaceae cyanobacterium bins.114]|nr:rhomboid family intramembrane serine protease [Oculatellaceae cyanobacterium bins.114]
MKGFKRQTEGSCVCVFCNQLISVDNPICPQCNRKNPSLWGYSRSLRRLGADLGFTKIVIWGCVALYLATLLIDFSNIHSSGLFDLLSPSNLSLVLFGASGAIPVFELGRWWTVLSAGWLHGSLLHILFNLLWINQFAPQVAQAFGSGRLVIIYTTAIVVGSLLSSIAGQVFLGIPILQGAQVTIGASGGLFGLLGALVAYGQITGKFSVKHQALTYVLIMFLFGFIMPNVDNWAHFGGFLGGYLVSILGGMDPRRAESLRHLFLAIACLALTIISILASILHGLLWLTQQFSS